jgi:hypothetical protein
MTKPFDLSQSFDPETASACVKRAQGRLCLTLDAELTTGLRAITFATRSGSDADSWYALKDSLSRRAAGEAAHCVSFDVTDPVQSYLVVRLLSDIVLEAVIFRSDPMTLLLYHQGAGFARLVEQNVSAPVGWWRRLLGGKRLWMVYANDELLASIVLEYPVRKTTRLLLVCENGLSLPIGVASRWRHKDSSFVIPPDTAEIDNAGLERLHFLVAVIFRIVVCHVDLSSS